MSVLRGAADVPGCRLDDPFPWSGCRYRVRDYVSDLYCIFGWYVGYRSADGGHVCVY